VEEEESSGRGGPGLSGEDEATFTETSTVGTAGSNDEREGARGASGLGAGPGADGAERGTVSTLGPPNASVETEEEEEDASAKGDGATAGGLPGSNGKERASTGKEEDAPPRQGEDDLGALSPGRLLIFLLSLKRQPSESWLSNHEL